jgi:hypothetical protein
MNPQLLSFLALAGAAGTTVAVAPRVGAWVERARARSAARRGADPRARAAAQGRVGLGRASAGLFGIEPPVGMPIYPPGLIGGAPGPSYGSGPPAHVEVPEIPVYSDPITFDPEPYNAPAETPAATPYSSSPPPSSTPQSNPIVQAVWEPAPTQPTAADYFPSAAPSASAPTPPAPTAADYFGATALSGSRFVRR